MVRQGANAEARHIPRKEVSRMEETKTLDRLRTGRRAVIAGLNAPEAQRQRMLDLGFVPGRPVSALQESPWGDPVAYAVCGAVIALRRADAHRIGIHA